MAAESIVNDGDIHVDDLRRLISRLPAEQPVTDEYEARFTTHTAWYLDQREHLVGWLSEYNGPGAYGRKNPSTSGKHFYNHFRCVSGLIWLAEALGEDPAVVRQGVERADAGSSNPSSECAAFRRVVPWSRIAELVERHPVPEKPESEGGFFRGLVREIFRG